MQQKRRMCIYFRIFVLYVYGCTCTAVHVHVRDRTCTSGSTFVRCTVQKKYLFSKEVFSVLYTVQRTLVHVRVRVRVHVQYCNLLKFNLICYYVYSSCSCTVVVYFTFITFAHILDTCTCTTSTALHVLAHVHSYTHARTMRVQYTYSTCTCSRVDVYRMQPSTKISSKIDRMRKYTSGSTEVLSKVLPEVLLYVAFLQSYTRWYLRR